VFFKYDQFREKFTEFEKITEISRALPALILLPSTLLCLPCVWGGITGRSLQTTVIDKVVTNTFAFTSSRDDVQFTEP